MRPSDQPVGIRLAGLVQVTIGWRPVIITIPLVRAPVQVNLASPGASALSWAVLMVY